MIDRQFTREYRDLRDLVPVTCCQPLSAAEMTGDAGDMGAVNATDAVEATTSSSPLHGTHQSSAGTTTEQPL